MQYTLALLGLAASVMAKPMPQAVTSAISPSAAAPSGCNTSPPGSYFLSTVNVSQSTSMLAKRQGVDQGFSITINNGVMHDQDQYTGYIAANRQFQFDPPPGPQAGAIYTAGWSLCGNNTVALGGSTIFYSCVSGGFSNIYDQSQGQQCSQIFLSAAATNGQSGSSSASQAVSQTSDAQPQGATSAAGSSVAQTSDHQPQAATSAAGSAIAQTSDHQPQAATSAAGSAIQQTSDHQPQAATSAAGSAIQQTSDHQPQAATSAPASAIQQTSDHQPQAPTAAGNATAVATPAAYTGAAVINKPEVLALAAGAVALLF